jgi:pilus assembly protein Flp/PilA
MRSATRHQFHIAKDLHMLYLINLVNLLRRDEKGAALVEYGLLVGLIAVVCVIAITAVGTNVSTLFSKVAVDL